MHLGKDWYFKRSDFFISVSLVLGYLNIRHNIALIDNLLIALGIFLISFVRIKVEEDGLSINSIKHKWEDFRAVKFNKDKIMLFYKKFIFISSFKLDKKHEDKIKNNIYR